MSALGLYLYAFLPKWWALVSGAALFGVERFADRYSPWLRNQLDRIPTHVRRFIEISLFLLAFFYAGFSAWNDERNTDMAEKCKIEKSEDRSAARNQLAAFMQEAQKLSNVSVLTTNSSQEEVKAWFLETQNWQNQLYTWTKVNLGEAAATKVVDTLNMPSGSWSNQISPEHNQKLSVIAKIEHNIGDLMESSPWDDFDVRVAKSIDACKAQ
jgi:hypothetical protein